MNITLNDNYEKCLVVLALRQFSTNQLREAIKALESNQRDAGASFQERSTKASEIASRLELIG